MYICGVEARWRLLVFQSPWFLWGRLFPPAAACMLSDYSRCSGLIWTSLNIKTVCFLLAHDAKQRVRGLEAPEDRLEGPGGTAGPIRELLCKPPSLTAESETSSCREVLSFSHRAAERRGEIYCVLQSTPPMAHFYTRSVDLTLTVGQISPQLEAATSRNTHTSDMNTAAFIYNSTHLFQLY